MGFDNIGFDPFASGSSASASSVTVTPTPLPDYPINPQDGFYASSDPSVYVGSTPGAPVASPGLPVAEIQPTYTPYPTLTPYPTQRPFFGTIMAIGYSYYFPPLGPPNCSAENWKEFYCEDVTASGLPWSDYIGRGVAVPLAWAEYIPLGSTVRVHSPESMIGDYVVLDYCGGCIKPEGHIYFDFLDNRARLNWTVPMLVEIIKP
jgi:hypothetical protein